MGYAEELAARVRARQAASCIRDLSSPRPKPSKTLAEEAAKSSRTPKKTSRCNQRNEQGAFESIDLDSECSAIPAEEGNKAMLRGFGIGEPPGSGSKAQGSLRKYADEEVLDLTNDFTELERDWPLNKKGVGGEVILRKSRDSKEDVKLLSRRKRSKRESDSDEVPRPRKRGRPKKKDNVIVEKRGARYRAVPSRCALERLERTFTHRLYLVERLPKKDGILEREFAVMGSGGNVYRVSIGKDPRCDCPDYEKQGGNPCKHIFFILHRVLRVARDDPCLWQKRLLSSEVQTIFDNASAGNFDTSIVADPAITEKYSQIRRSQGSEAENAEATRRPLEDSCAICMEDFDSQSGEATVWCKSCGNNLHRDCMSRWLCARGSQGGAKCPFCRESWREGGSLSGRDIYVNLADLSSKHQCRFTLQDLYPDTYMFLDSSRRRNAVPFSRQRRR